MLCKECHHRPSERFEEGSPCRCYCPCHDVADAAPELLAALRGLDAAIAGIHLSGDHTSRAINELANGKARKAARAAIAKAKAEKGGALNAAQQANQAGMLSPDE